MTVPAVATLTVDPVPNTISPITVAVPPVGKPVTCKVGVPVTPPKLPGVNVNVVVSPAFNTRELGLACNVTPGVAHCRTALNTFNRPPVAVFPVNTLRGSTVCNKTRFKPAVSKLPQADNTSAAAPATCGVAIDVPLIVAYCPFKNVDKILLPGAAKCTFKP